MEIRNYQQGDEKCILNLFKLVFKKDMPENFWKWRFLENPTGYKMIKLMWDNDTLAGHYAVSPVCCLVNDEMVLTALSMTTMTHPDYTGRGIFKELAEVLYNDEFNKNSLVAIWGYPNTNSHYGFIKNLKWVDIEQIPSFSITPSKIKKTDNNNIGIVEVFNENHYNAFLEITDNYKVRVNRTPEYLNWRYNHNPVNNYSVFEYADDCKVFYAVAKVFPSFSEKGKFEIDILELMFPPDLDLITNLFNKIIDYFANYDILKINCWLPLQDKKHILMEKMGFENQSPITYSGARIMDERLSFMSESKNWFYCMADSDIY